MESDNYSLADFIEYNHPDIFKKTELFYEFYTDYKNKASFTFFRPLLTASGPKVTIRDNHTGKKKEMIMMASNNYLGLASRPEVIEAGKKALEKYGISLGGSPFLCGYSDLHEELEKKLAEFKNCEDTVIFPSGFATNVGTISSLARRNDIIFSDRLDHASIIDGSIFSGSKMRGFRHNDLCQLEKRLQKQQNSQGGKLIIVEGIYSMDGDLAPLDKIKKLATTYNARLMVDEAHATGVLGKNGKGAIEHFGLEGEIDLVIGTFSKTFGAQGGFVCTTKETATYIRCYGRPYLFSASLSPVIVASVLKSLEIIQNEPQLREKLWDNIRYMKKNLTQEGFDIGDTHSAIIPIAVGDDLTLKKIASELHEKNLFINSIYFPAVPQNSSRLRMSLMATHTKEDLDKTLTILRDVCKKHNII